MPRVSVDVKDHNGKLTTYEGVALAELLKAAGAPIGEKLRGANMASYVLAEAKDGYRVVFALPKLDSAFTDSEVLVAYAANGKPLPDGQGPFRIVVPKEKRPARWVRMLLRIQVVKTVVSWLQPAITKSSSRLRSAEPLGLCLAIDS